MKKTTACFVFINGVRNIIVAEGRDMEEIKSDAWKKARSIAFKLEGKVKIKIEIGSLTFGLWTAEFEA